MKKLKLTLEALRVESFRTEEEELAQRGTVRGNASDSTCMERQCMCSAATDWDFTCGTCDRRVATCDGDCATFHTCPTSPGYQGC